VLSVLSGEPMLASCVDSPGTLYAGLISPEDARALVSQPASSSAELCVAQVSGAASLRLLALLKVATALLYSGHSGHPTGDGASATSFHPLWDLAEGSSRLQCHVGVLATVRTGLLEVVPLDALACLSAASLETAWGGLPLSTSLIRTRCSQVHRCGLPADGVVAEELVRRSSRDMGLSLEQEALCAEAASLFWKALDVLEAEDRESAGGQSWLEGLLTLWTGCGRIPMRAPQEDLELCAPLSGISRTSSVPYAGDDAEESPQGQLALSVSFDPTGHAPSVRPLPRASTCDWRLDIVAWPGESVEGFVKVLKTSISHGAVGFAYE
jgi:hypothetical protein